MDSLFHFVFAFIAGMAINARIGHHTPLQVAAVAFLSILIDVDHVLFAYNRAFHTVFIAVLLPLLLFYTAYRYERRTGGIRYQSLAILLLVMLVGHVIADMLNGGALQVLYPLSDVTIHIPSALRLSFIQKNWYLLSPDGVALAVYGGVIAAAYYTEAFIERFEKSHEAMGAAVRSALRA